MSGAESLQTMEPTQSEPGPHESTRSVSPTRSYRHDVERRERALIKKLEEWRTSPSWVWFHHPSLVAWYEIKQAEARELKAYISAGTLPFRKLRKWIEQLGFIELLWSSLPIANMQDFLLQPLHALQKKEGKWFNRRSI